MPSLQKRMAVALLCLAAWVELAERRGLAWGLRLPGLELPCAQGDAHRRLALEKLATWA